MPDGHKTHPIEPARIDLIPSDYRLTSGGAIGQVSTACTSHLYPPNSIRETEQKFVIYPGIAALYFVIQFDQLCR